MKKLSEEISETPKVLLEAERNGKKFKFQQRKVTKTWEKKNTAYNGRFFSRSTTETTSTQYEMLWGNIGSEKMGRTIFVNSKGSSMSYRDSISNFFKALEASDKVNYVEIVKN